MTIAPPVSRSSKTPISAPSVCWTRASSGHDPLGEHVDDVAVGVVRLEQLAQVGAARADEARRQQSAPHGQEVRDESDGEPESRGDLGRVLVLADAIRSDVLEHRRRRARTR